MCPSLRPVAAALVLLLGTTASLGLQAQAPHPVIGKWKLNLAKSKFEPGPPPQSAVRTYEDRGGGVIHATFEGIGAQGNPTFTQYAVKYDGKEYPWLVRGAQTAGAIAFKIIDERTSEFTIRGDGKITSAGTANVSADGMTYTVISKGTNPQGQPTSSVQVFERQ